MVLKREDASAKLVLKKKRGNKGKRSGCSACKARTRMRASWCTHEIQRGHDITYAERKESQRRFHRKKNMTATPKKYVQEQSYSLTKSWEEVNNIMVMGFEEPKHNTKTKKNMSL